MLSRTVGHRLDPVIAKIAKWIIRRPINPNLLTLAGLVLNGVAALLLAFGQWFAAGWVILGGGVCDLLDGAVARDQGKATPFGGFFDSVIDRYSEIFLFLGIVVFYIRSQGRGAVVLAMVTFAGAMMVSYTRARAEAVIPACSVGIMERAERILLLAVGAIFDGMIPVLWVIAILSHFTAAHRIHHAWRELNRSRPV
jgi:CDP-diacylglycerol--glycerol-3-phosphate 3-phosphatidyltransferase